MYIAILEDTLKILSAEGTIELTNKEVHTIMRKVLLVTYTVEVDDLIYYGVSKRALLLQRTWNKSRVWSGCMLEDVCT